MSLIYKGQTIADVGGGSSSEEVYSTEETRIGTWMEKPLYRKILNVSSISIGTTRNMTLLLSFSDKDLVSAHGKAIFNSTDSDLVPLTDFDDNKPLNLHFTIYKNDLFLVHQWSVNATIISLSAVVEYTKTTDAAKVVRQ